MPEGDESANPSDPAASLQVEVKVAHRASSPESSEHPSPVQRNR
jgi:hypothetical protein